MSAEVDKISRRKFLLIGGILTVGAIAIARDVQVSKEETVLPSPTPESEKKAIPTPSPDTFNHEVQATPAPYWQPAGGITNLRNTASVAFSIVLILAVILIARELNKLLSSFVLETSE